MTSFYASYGFISQLTMDLYSQVRHHRTHDGRAELDFYLSYLEDVVPDGITVQEGTPFQIGHGTAPIYEVDLVLTDTGRTFMSGLVSTVSIPDDLEELAGNEAEEKYREGLFVRDDGTWRFFTATGRLRCYNYHGPRWDWEFMGEFSPARDAEELAAHLQQQYDSLASH